MMVDGGVTIVLKNGVWSKELGLTRQPTGPSESFFTVTENMTQLRPTYARAALSLNRVQTQILISQDTIYDTPQTETDHPTRNTHSTQTPTRHLRQTINPVPTNNLTPSNPKTTLRY
jgi:hypothetical protein